eukprot:scaffold92555_cov36-Phaeocystis_antarctica.AAC.2
MTLAVTEGALGPTPCLRPRVPAWRRGKTRSRRGAGRAPWRAARGSRRTCNRRYARVWAATLGVWAATLGVWAATLGVWDVAARTRPIGRRGRESPRARTCACSRSAPAGGVCEGCKG